MNGFNTPTPSSSRPFLSGEPYVLNRLMRQTTELPSIVASAIAAAVLEEDDRLQRNYADKGIEATAKVTYDVDNSKFVYTAKGEAAVDTEYGGPTSNPQATLRKSAVRGADRIQKVLEREIKKGLEKV